MAQEGVGIYTFDAEPDGAMHLTLTEDDLLLEEGDNGQGFLFISSQGNYTFGVFNRPSYSALVFHGGAVP